MPKKNDDERAGRPARIFGMSRFRVQMIAFMVLYTVVVFAALYFQAQQLLRDTLRAEASSYFKLVYHTRQWNADHGGVWVLKRDDVQTNPYLVKLGIPADTRTESGTDLTLRNPSAMVSGISDLTEQATGVTFHMTSDRPINPANSPDEWERGALERFVHDGVEYVETIDRSTSPPTYRYMKPLIVEDACLDCHAPQGYEIGDIRGAITIDIPMGDIVNQLNGIAATLLGLTVVTLGLSLGAGQYALSRLESRVADANSRLARMAVTDELTGVPNRRATYERLSVEFARSKRTRQPLSVVLLDIDYFKRVNDSYGHGVGDDVLRETSHRMQDGVREYDVFGRIGGEEFLVIAPDTDEDEALGLAERLVEQLRVEPIVVGEIALFITASAGAATLSAEDERPDDLIARADVALYHAKQSGRDRAQSADLR